MVKKEKISIIGAGALGGYYGARMAKADFDVHFLMRSDYQAVSRRGLTVKSCKGDFHLDSVQCYQRVQDIGPSDIVFIGLKTTANSFYKQLIAPLVTPDTLILTAQNGLGNEQQLAKLFGDDHIAGGLAFICSNRTHPGIIDHQDYGHIHIANYNRLPDNRLLRFAHIMRQSDIDCKVVQDLALARWQKLVWNVPFNGLSTWLDRTVDKIVQDDALKAMAWRLMKEVQAAARADLVEIPDDFLNLMMTNTQKMVPYYTSMHLDRRQGRPMEIESIFGEPLRRAQQKSIPVPELESLYHNLIQLQPK